MFGAARAAAFIVRHGAICLASKTTFAIVKVMTQNNLLLISSSYAGEGSYMTHCWNALKNFYGDSGDKYVLFIPYANAYDWQRFADECIADFEKHNIKMKSILDYTDPRTALGDKNLAGVFVAGGNTFKLLKYLYDYTLIDAIKLLVNDGLPYAGASAGAVVACPGIYTTNDMPMVEPQSLKALGLIPFQINPHFVSGELVANHHGETREQRIRQFQTEHNIPVVGLRESGWLEIHGNSAELGGSEPGVLFAVGKEPVQIGPGLCRNLQAYLTTSASACE